MDRYEIDSCALPARRELIARILAGGGGLPAAPGPQSVLLRALMLNRPDYERDLGPSDILLVPPIPAEINHLDWHRHRDLRLIARKHASAQLSRLAAEGHPLLRRPDQPTPAA